MDKDLRLAVEEFESACDAAIASLGAGNANTILNQRFDRDRIITERSMMEKNPGPKMNQAGMAGQLASQAYMAGRHLDEEKACAEVERTRTSRNPHENR